MKSGLKQSIDIDGISLQYADKSEVPYEFLPEIIFYNIQVSEGRLGQISVDYRRLGELSIFGDFTLPRKPSLPKFNSQQEELEYLREWASKQPKTRSPIYDAGLNDLYTQIKLSGVQDDYNIVSIALGLTTLVELYDKITVKRILEFLEQDLAEQSVKAMYNLVVS